MLRLCQFTNLSTFGSEFHTFEHSSIVQRGHCQAEQKCWFSYLEWVHFCNWGLFLPRNTRCLRWLDLHKWWQETASLRWNFAVLIIKSWMIASDIKIHSVTFQSWQNHQVSMSRAVLVDTKHLLTRRICHSLFSRMFLLRSSRLTTNNLAWTTQMNSWTNLI